MSNIPTTKKQSTMGEAKQLITESLRSAGIEQSEADYWIGSIEDPIEQLRRWRVIHEWAKSVSSDGLPATRQTYIERLNLYTLEQKPLTNSTFIPSKAKPNSNPVVTNGYIRTRMQLPCIHLGALTGEVKDCQTCGGKKKIEIHNCPLHTECTWKSQLIAEVPGKGVQHYPWCIACKDYVPKVPNKLQEQAESIKAAHAAISPTIELPTMPMQWSYGVTTVWEDAYQRKHSERRNQLLPKTLQSLKEGGFDKPILFVDGCDFQTAMEYEKKFGLHVEVKRKNIQTYGNWFSAIHELYMRNPKAQRYALFQDDFVTYKNVRQYLEWCPYPHRGYLNLYTFPDNRNMCPRKGGTGERITGWYESNQRGLGAVALVFNNEAVRTLITTWHMVDRSQGPTPHSAVDGGIVEALRSGPIKYKEYCHNPSLIQHTGIISSMGNGAQSMSENFEKLPFDALELIPRYNSDKVPLAPSSIQLGGPRPPRT